MLEMRGLEFRFDIGGPNEVVAAVFAKWFETEEVHFCCGGKYIEFDSYETQPSYNKKGEKVGKLIFLVQLKMPYRTGQFWKNS